MAEPEKVKVLEKIYGTHIMYRRGLLSDREALKRIINILLEMPDVDLKGGMKLKRLFEILMALLVFVFLFSNPWIYGWIKIVMLILEKV